MISTAIRRLAMPTALTATLSLALCAGIGASAASSDPADEAPQPGTGFEYEVPSGFSEYVGPSANISDSTVQTWRHFRSEAAPDDGETTLRLVPVDELTKSELDSRSRQVQVLDRGNGLEPQVITQCTAPLLPFIESGLPITDPYDIEASRSVGTGPNDSWAYAIAGSYVPGVGGDQSMSNIARSGFTGFVNIPEEAPSGTVTFYVAPWAVGHMRGESNVSAPGANPSTARAYYENSMRIFLENTTLASQVNYRADLLSNEGIERQETVEYNSPQGVHYHEVSAVVAPNARYGFEIAAEAGASATRGLDVIGSGASSASDFGSEGISIPSPFGDGRTRASNGGFVLEWNFVGYTVDC